MNRFMTAISDIEGFHGHMWVQAGLLILYILSLMYIIKCNNNKDHTLIAFVIICAGIAYLPMSAMVLIPDVMPTINEYSRLGWMMMPIVVIAYGTTRLAENKGVSRVDADKPQGPAIHERAIVAGILILIILAGNRSYRDIRYELPTNIYKLPQAVVDIGEAIAEDAEQTGGFSYITDEGERVAVETATDSSVETPIGIEVAVHGLAWDFVTNNASAYSRISYGLRQYDPRFRITWMVVGEDAIRTDATTLTQALPEYDRYAVILDIPEATVAMDDAGYTKLLTEDGYVLYRL